MSSDAIREALRRAGIDTRVVEADHGELLEAVEGAEGPTVVVVERQRTSRAKAPVVASPAMQRVWAVVDRVAPTDLSVLVTGPSGTGKEVVARQLHERSRRAERPLVTMDCAAIPPNLMESELFGHSKGAFTGALKDRRGLASQADGGTLFLDEIGELGPEVQTRLLRLLQEGEIRPVGSDHPIKVDLRIVAATNRDLFEEVARGRFRQDVFHRLNTVHIQIPPLSERREEIPVLFEHFVDTFSRRTGRARPEISGEAVAILQAWHWPGNVRELANAARYATSLVQGPRIEASDLPASVRPNGGAPRNASGPSVDHTLTYMEARRRWLDAFEDAWFEPLMAEHGDNVSEVARVSGVDRRSVQRWKQRRGREG